MLNKSGRLQMHCCLFEDPFMGIPVSWVLLLTISSPNLLKNSGIYQTHAFFSPSDSFTCGEWCVVLFHHVHVMLSVIPLMSLNYSLFPPSADFYGMPPCPASSYVVTFCSHPFTWYCMHACHIMKSSSCPFPHRMFPLLWLPHLLCVFLFTLLHIYPCYSGVTVQWSFPFSVHWVHLQFTIQTVSGCQLAWLWPLNIYSAVPLSKSFLSPFIFGIVNIWPYCLFSFSSLSFLAILPPPFLIFSNYTLDKCCKHSKGNTECSGIPIT